MKPDINKCSKCDYDKMQISVYTSNVYYSTPYCLKWTNKGKPCHIGMFCTVYDTLNFQPK